MAKSGFKYNDLEGGFKAESVWKFWFQTHISKSNNWFVKMIYCCDRFKFRHEITSYKSINIRIIKYNFNELFTEKNPYRFYLSSPFDKDEISKDNFLISHCPFCGENLFEFYKDDIYINCNKDSFNLI